MTNYNKKHLVLVLIYIIVSLRFFYYAGMNIDLQKFLQMLSIPLMFIICWNYIFNMKTHHILFRTMRWILFSLTFSIVSAWLFWGQSLSLGFRITSIQFAFLFFFYLCKIKPHTEFLEKIIWICGITYIVLWIYAFTQAPTPVFGIKIDEETGLLNDDIKRGMIRVNFIGSTFLVFAFFLALNKFYAAKKKYFLVIAGIFFLFIILQLTRQIIIWSLLVGLVYIYLKNPKRILGIGFISTFAIVLFAGNLKLSDESVIGSLINVSQEQIEKNKSGDEDIRITEYKYLFTEWSKNLVTDIIGNGVPHSNSQYGNFNTRLCKEQGIYYSDVGYAAMYVIQGWIGLFLYIFLFIKTVRLQMPVDLDYARMFMAYMIPANIAADWYAKPDCQIALCICVYLIMLYGRKQRGGILATPDFTSKNVRLKQIHH